VKNLPPFLQRFLLITVAFVAISVVLHLVFPLPAAPSYSTVVLDNKGEVIHAFLTPDEKWRMKTDLAEISPMLKVTLLYKEDKYFYYHPGVNVIAIARAAVMNVLRLKRTSGASTITMQVARMLEPKRRTYFNKLIEVFRAFQLEWTYSKDEILQLYINKMPFGSNIEGVKSASVLYFKKNPDHLSLAEVTALSIIPNRPSSLRMGRNNDKIIAERNKWLLLFAEGHLFTATEISDALDEPLTARRNDAPKLAPHLSLKLKRSATSEIIRTPIDLQMQFKSEKIVGDYVRNLYSLNIRNAAVMVVDNKTHEVVTYIGSADFNAVRDGGQVNGASAIRQPGSALKPLIYGLCFDQGVLIPKTMMSDVPINLGGFAPENYDEQFHGLVSAEYALENSLNIPAVKALNSIGTSALVQRLSACGFRQIKKDQNKLGLSLALGGCGVSLEEMTGLYAALANEGVFVPPIYTSTQTIQPNLRKGDMGERTKPLEIYADSITLLSPSATFMLNEILSRLARPDLPVNWEASMHTPRIAWKTGTSYGRRDAWSIGYNRNYTIGVWVGNFSGEGVPELNGANIATPLLFKLFNTLDYNSTNEWFSMPKECGIRLVCSETGMLPSSQCTNTVMDYFLPMISPAMVCNNRQEFATDPAGKITYCRHCQPEAGFKKQWFKVIAPDMQAYYEEHRMAYEPLPPHNPACDKVFVEGAPVIKFPVDGAEYLISKRQPEPLQLRCETTGDVQLVYWTINNKFFQQTPVNKTLFFNPEEGNVKISCTDDKGRNTNIRIKVKFVDL
jgi:penicillin-binding protein 1C